jgi:YesN/AraC family two-component response regulator
LKLREAAAKAFMNLPYFSACFKKTMKMTVTNYITILRVNHAARLLKETTIPVTEVCFESGFKTIAYFDRVFKKLMGVSPREYRIKS